MPPAYVKPYVKRQKNDTTDAEAICEAVTRTNMRFVPTKTAEQQSGLVLHRARHLFIRQQTSVINAIRAHTLANMNVALERACQLRPDGEDHRFRKLVARRIIQCAAMGKNTLGALTKARFAVVRHGRERG
jgi:transposase